MKPSLQILPQTIALSSSIPMPALSFQLMQLQFSKLLQKEIKPIKQKLTCPSTLGARLGAMISGPSQILG